MKSTAKQGCITQPKTKKQCRLYQNLSAYAAALDRLPEAQEVQKNKGKSAPLDLLPMVF